MARDIALCLSGGGYRAAWFNLGVLRKLDDLELLDRIGIISSVSGGSILAGFYATALLNQQPFSEFVEKVTRFLQRRIPLDYRAWPQDFVPWSTSSKALERSYSKAFQSGQGAITLNHLCHVAPRFVFNATAVHNGAGWRFLSNGTAELWDLISTHSRAFEARYIRYKCPTVTLGAAVAASSAFPAFSAVAISRSALELTGDRYQPNPEVEGVTAPLDGRLPDPLVLSDGGIVDNIGLTSVMTGMVPPDAPGSFCLIASDAGATLPPLKQPSTGRFRRLRYVLRQLDIQGSHNNDMTTLVVVSHQRMLKTAKGVAILRINRAVPHAGETIESVARLGEIKTGLRRLPPGDTVALMEHAGNLVWTRLTEYTVLLPESKLMPGAEKKVRSDANAT
jgi:NTE family protein